MLRRNRTTRIHPSGGQVLGLAALCVGMFPGVMPAQPAIPLAEVVLTPDIDEMCARAREFNIVLERALHASPIHGTTLQSRLKEWSDTFKDELERMAQAAHESDDRGLKRHFQMALAAAAGLNAVMVRRGFSAAAGEQWRRIRTDLNSVAEDLQQQTLPDMTLLMFVPDTAVTLDRAEIRGVMDQVEARTDAFKRIVQRAANMTSTTTSYELLRKWTGELESATDRLLDEYKQRHATQYHFRLEESLLIATGIQRLLPATAHNGDALPAWLSIRKYLDVLAKAMGYPVVAAR